MLNLVDYVHNRFIMIDDKQEEQKEEEEKKRNHYFFSLWFDSETINNNKNEAFSFDRYENIYQKLFMPLTNEPINDNVYEWNVYECNGIMKLKCLIKSIKNK